MTLVALSLYFYDAFASLFNQSPFILIAWKRGARTFFKICSFFDDDFFFWVNSPKKYVRWRTLSWFHRLSGFSPDLHLFCVRVCGGSKCSVVWSDDLGNHGGHAPDWAGLWIGSGHRTLIQSGSLRKALRDGPQVQKAEWSAVAVPSAVLPL